MPLEQTLGLPFFDDFPVHTQIRIQPDGREYVAYVQAGWAKWHRFRIGLKQHDVEELNSELQQAIEHVSACFDVEDVDSAEYTKGLSKLAQKGNFAFKRIFAEGAPRQTISQALQAGSTLQASSEDFFIPWELLYDGPLGSQVDVSCFWGMQYIISRTLIQDARPGDFVSPVIRSSRPRVGLVAYDQLSHVIKEEIPALRRLRRQKRIYLSFLRPLDISQHDDELDKFGSFLEKKLQVTHLACHAYVKQPPSQSYLLVSDDFPITIEDFRVREFDIKHKPLVILNACLTGTMNPLYTSNWASVFWERGARGVLATEFRVPDWFAAAFIEGLYEHLLSGEPIGKGLLANRLRFWEERSNPLGLAYALYSSPSIRIAH
jgi:hypothetical protein